MTIQKYIYCEKELCTGCMACVLACSAYHEKAFSRAGSRITVLNDDFFDYAIACKHCAKPVCMDVCPTNAILKRGELVTVIEKKCIGCALCIEACPFGAIHIYKNVAIICDLCDGNMECVKVCIQNALKVFKAGRIGENRRARITRRLKRAFEFHAISPIPPLEVEK